MHWALFLDSERMAWAVTSPPEAEGKDIAPINFKFFGRASLGVTLLIFEECGLMDLVVLREVCIDFKEALDSNQSVWANVRVRMLNMPSPPIDLHGTRGEEHAWAVHILTGTTAVRQDIDPEWSASYIKSYKRYRGYNVWAIKGHICADNPEQVIKRRRMSRICQGYLRSPTCEKLLRVHVRDLKVVNTTIWKAALPTIHRELGLISSCDPNRVPRGFHFDPDDRILCPACHADSEAARQRAISLPSLAERREWFKKNTIQVRSVYVHYRAEHKDLVARHGLDINPAIDCYALCAICQQLPAPANEHPWHGSIYTVRDLRDHYERR
ncbi:hypothetical protein FB107DRAFT_273406 [Schizophyllum commune]